MNNIDENSIKEVINAYKQLKGWSGKITKNIFDKNDIVFSDLKNRKIVAEVKERKFDIDQIIKYNKLGYMLEESKYNYLKKYKSLYINYIKIKEYDIEIIISFDVEDVDYNINEQNCPKTSYFSQNNKIIKKTINVPLEKNNGLYVKRNGIWKVYKNNEFEDMLDNLSIDFMKKLIK